MRELGDKEAARGECEMSIHLRGEINRINMQKVQHATLWTPDDCRPAFRNKVPEAVTKHIRIHTHYMHRENNESCRKINPACMHRYGYSRQRR